MGTRSSVKSLYFTCFLLFFIPGTFCTVCHRIVETFQHGVARGPIEKVLYKISLKFPYK